MQTLKVKFAKFAHKYLLSIAATLILFNFATAAPAFAAGPCDQKSPTSASLKQCLDQNPIVKDLKKVVNFLSAGVGIVIVGSVIFGAIQYIMAGNNPNAVGAAKKRLQDALIALLAFFFIYAFLSWIVPGGLLFNL